jgi:hypothetical protein
MEGAWFLGAFLKCIKATLSFVIEQLGSHCMDFREIWCLRICGKSFKTNQGLLKSDKNKRYCTLRAVCICGSISLNCRSQWPCRLSRRSTAARLLRSWVRIPPGAWIFVCCVYLCCQVEVSATSWSLFQEESHRLWRAVVCDQETSWTRMP